MELVKIKDKDISNKFELPLLLIHYAPIGNNIPIMIKRVHIKRGKKVVEKIRAFLVSNETGSNNLLLIPYKLVVNTCSNGSFTTKEGDYFLDCDIKIGLECIGFINHTMAVCKFDYWHEYNEKFDTELCKRQIENQKNNTEYNLLLRNFIDKHKKHEGKSLKELASKMNISEDIVKTVESMSTINSR